MPQIPEERDLLSSGQISVIDLLATKKDAPLEERLEMILLDLQQNYPQHQRRVEDYLVVTPELVPEDDCLIRIILAEFTSGTSTGETPRQQEYIDRLPALQKILLKILGKDNLDAAASLATQSGDAQVILASRYKLIGQPVGSGAFGCVYLALDMKLDRPVAIKLPNVDSPIVNAKTYLGEARTLAKFQHPNIVSVYDIGTTEEGQTYIVSQFVWGGTLKSDGPEFREDYQRIAKTIAAVAEALQFAHDRKVIHRDIKPANILIDNKTHEPLLADFGLAIMEEDLNSSSCGGGTPAYMSPEQARGESHRLDGRTDIFSLGVVLYELLTGQLPFRGPQGQLINSILQDDPAVPTSIDPNIPLELERICLKALSKQASDRYATASIMAEELRSWDVVLSLAVEDRFQKRITPKGLRSFDETDADYFLSLLPGPHNRDGLPESVAFWKEKFEQRDPDKTFTVGLIYGPSGCGKSSLFKAGLIPRLSSNLIAIYVEATAEETEQRMLRGLRKALPHLPPNLRLVDALRQLRRGEFKKVVFIIDQFEQWLHANCDFTEAELTNALRQCDGEHVQGIVMIRDDFAMAAARFMDALDVPIVQGENFATVDLFDREHARKVLIKFGQAFKKIPADEKERTDQQNRFLDQVVSGLAQDGKVISIQIALFAEMVKDKPWVIATLEEIGGTEGIGVSFLEETFGARSANPKHKVHQQAARQLLAALLPEVGSDIKGHMRSSADLLQGSIYKERSDDFDELLRILEGQLRLITLTDPEGIERGKVGGEKSGNTNAAGASNFSLPPSYFQLTHDFLVPSLREWLARKQRETKQGRAELKLAERATAWGVNKENKQLPTLVEWFQIRYWTNNKRWTIPEQSLMWDAARVHARNWGSSILVFAILMGVIGYLFQQQHLLGQRKYITDTLDLLQETLGPAVQVNIEKLLDIERPDLVRPDLERRYVDAKESKEKLSLALGLASFGQVEVVYLISQIDDIEYRDTSNLIMALGHDRQRSIEKLKQLASECCGEDLWKRKARLALVALALGDTELPIDACEFEWRPDHGARTWFIHEFPNWELNIGDAIKTVANSDSPALRSAICLAIGGIAASKVSAGNKERMIQTATQWFSLPDSSTHSAVAWLMREWGITEPRVTDANQMVEGRNWFANSQGVTFVKITPVQGDANVPEYPYWMANREVTREEYEEFLNDTNYTGQKPTNPIKPNPVVSPNPTHPAQNVSWYDAVMYCNWLSRREGHTPAYRSAGREKINDYINRDVELEVDKWEFDERANGYRLPRDLEWEYACRARSDTAWSSGSDELLLISYCQMFPSKLLASLSGKKLPNAWGLHDMHGNISEWCWNSHELASLRVVRGGNLYSDAALCGSEYRSGAVPTQRSPRGGFRLALNAPREISE